MTAAERAGRDGSGAGRWAAGPPRGRMPTVHRILRLAATKTRALLGPRLLAVMVLGPLIVVGLAGCIFEGAFKETPVLVVDQDAGVGNLSLPRAILGSIDDRDVIDVVGTYGPAGAGDGDLERCLEELRDGEVRAVIVFGPNFTSQVLSAAASARAGMPVAPVVLTVHLDGSHPILANSVLADVQVATQAALAAQLRMTPLVRVNALQVYGQQPTLLDFIGPGFACLIAFLLGFVLTAVTFASDRGSLPLALDPPATGAELVAGYATYAALVAIIQSSTIVGTLLLFPVELKGGVGLVLLAILLLMLVGQALALLVVTLSRGDLRAVVGGLPVFLFPSVLLSGYVVPVAGVPALLRPLCYLVPMTYGLDACRGVANKGWGPGDAWPQLCALLLFEVLLLIASAAVARRRGQSSPGERPSPVPPQGRS